MVLNFLLKCVPEQLVREVSNMKNGGPRDDCHHYHHNYHQRSQRPATPIAVTEHRTRNSRHQRYRATENGANGACQRRRHTLTGGVVDSTSGSAATLIFNFNVGKWAAMDDKIWK